jgi:ATP synthase protein I
MADRPPDDPAPGDPAPGQRDDDDRFGAFGDRLRAARARGAKKSPERGYIGREKGSALGLAFRVSVEVVSALAVGLGIGLLLDHWLGTRPWLMLVFLVLGGCAGMLNVYRVAQGFGYAVGYDKNGGGTDDGEDSKGT